MKKFWKWVNLDPEKEKEQEQETEEEPGTDPEEEPETDPEEEPDEDDPEKAKNEAYEEDPDEDDPENEEDPDEDEEKPENEYDPDEDDPDEDKPENEDPDEDEDKPEDEEPEEEDPDEDDPEKMLNIDPDEEERERCLLLNGTIAEESWFDDDITPQIFREELFADKGPVTVYINSPGGDCIAASQIYTMLSEYPGKVTVKIDGIAASAASVIAMAGETVLMAPTAMMMIHNPATMAFGDHNDMQKAIDVLNEVKESIINAYELKTHLSRAKIAKLMEDETWMNAKKALELGFCDKLIKSENRMAATNCAFSFSTKIVEGKLMNKISKRRTVNAKGNAKPAGRKISDLMNQLNTVKNFI